MTQEVISISITSHVDDLGRNCALCNRIFEPRKRSHQLIALRSDTKHHVNTKNIIIEKLKPLEICEFQYICHPCWQKCDRTARKYSGVTPTKGSKLRCVNCGINSNRNKRHILHNEAILVQVQRQVAPQIVTSNDYICDACHRLFAARDPIKLEIDEDAPAVGHKYICIVCGCSVARIHNHSLGEESNSHIIDVVSQWIQPREVKKMDLICHKCFQRADSTAIKNILLKTIQPLPQNTDRIILPNYSRASDTHNRCTFLHCTSTSQIVFPFVLRVKLFREYKYYVPPNCRLCELHLRRQSWSELLNTENINRSFTAAHIEDFCELLKYDNH